MPARRRTLLIRTDASPEIGTGHVMRCLALARQWQEAGFGDVAFMGRIDCERLRDWISRAGCDFVAHHPGCVGEDLEAVRAELAARGEGTPWLVLDGYGFGPEYHDAAQEAGAYCLCIDDQADLPGYRSDVVLNQNPHGESAPYGMSGGSPVLLTGPRFALLRPEFRAQSGPRPVPARAGNILLTFGGSDPAGAAPFALEALLGPGGPEQCAITVLAGPANPSMEAIRRAAGMSARVRIIESTADMPGLMARSDLAVTACGGTCWEMACMGVPMVAVTTADNQQGIGTALKRAGAAVHLGLHPGVEGPKLAAAVRTLAADPLRRRRMAEAGRALVDGAGAERVCDLLRFFAAVSDDRDLSLAPWLRQAGEEDAEALWRLNNDPEVRARSFSPEPIPWPDHEEWYEDRLVSPDCRIFLLEAGGVLAGQVRYELEKDAVNPPAARLSLAVGRGFRGRGIGPRLIRASLSAASRELGMKKVTAEVLPDNEASRRCFLRNGFVESGSVERRGGRALVFEKTLGNSGCGPGPAERKAG